MRRLILRFGSSVLLTTIVGVGAVHAAGAHIDNTGPWSKNNISIDNHSSFNLNNANTVNVTNSNNQTARSGDAKVVGNTWGGNATSGDAKNFNSTTTNVSISTPVVVPTWSGNNGGNFSITDTGPGSHNSIDVNNSDHVNINNHNDVNVSNSNHQTAISGDATVSWNTHGGNATSGDAINSNSTTTNVNIGGGDWGSNWSGNGNWNQNYAPRIGYVGSPVYGNNYGNNCCNNGYDGQSHNYKQSDHHRDYPDRPYDGFGGFYNPCVNPCETSHFKHSRLQVKSSYYPRHEREDGYMYKVDCYRPKHIQPCHVISHPPIRPPCDFVRPCRPVVVKPCHPVSPCKPVIHRSVCNLRCQPVHHDCFQRSNCERVNLCRPVHRCY